ncbi:hypothetical protein ARMSODRAFT_983253 [Armillaria solidipes]|uniref:Uncharacterized protein n=1 Tax=Armillaria solidipes TaxID=1076256 RepID=A0A2H3B3H6_9AGAR|nr:hypothetical protein ARMSODRAFT_983253 [Armillaria solidipes]
MFTAAWVLRGTVASATPTTTTTTCSSVEKPRLHLFQAQTITALDAAREISIPKGILKYLQEMGQVEEYKLYGYELKNVTLMADTIRLPFLHTLYAGYSPILRSIITPRLEGVHVQLFNKEFWEKNLPAFPLRSGYSLRKITFEDCILGMNKYISFLQTSPNLEDLVLCFTVWNDRMDSCLLEILPSKGGEEGEGGNLVPRLTKLNIVVQYNGYSRTSKIGGITRWWGFASVEVRAAVLVKEDMMASPGAGNTKRWNRLKEGGMEALFHVIGGKADDECPPASSRMTHVDPDPNSHAYLQREYD